MSGRHTPIATPVAAVEGRRRPIEDAFETAETELGLTHDEARSWHGWHRHVSLVMPALAPLAAVRHQAGSAPGRAVIDGNGDRRKLVVRDDGREVGAPP